MVSRRHGNKLFLGEKETFGGEKDTRLNLGTSTRVEYLGLVSTVDGFLKSAVRNSFKF